MVTKKTLIMALAVCVSIAIIGCPQKKTNRSVNPDGKVEIEDLKYTHKSKVITVTVDKNNKNNWSGSKGVVYSSTKSAEFVAYEIPVDDGIARNVVFEGVKSPEYGRYRVAINQLPTGKTIDFYGTAGAKTGEIDLGTFEPKNGKLNIVFALVGSNPKSRGERFGAGLDYMIITKATK